MGEVIKPIADIIARPIGGPLTVHYDGKIQPAQMVQRLESYTVDDLLAWLHERDVFEVVCESTRDAGPDYVRMVTLRTPWPERDRISIHTSPRSMLAALEKAVRAVDQASIAAPSSRP